MRMHYDKKIDALSIRFSKGPYQESEQVQEGVIFDYDRNGKIAGIEILDASKILPKNFQKTAVAKQIEFVTEKSRS